MVYRVYVEKKQGFRIEADNLLSDLQGFLGINNLKGIRIINRYDVENVEAHIFENAKNTVFSEPQVDDIYEEMPEAETIFAVEYLPGQFDQRADSAAQCIQIISCKERPTVRSAKVYIVEGNLSAKEIEDIKNYVINPVEAREASLAKPDTLAIEYAEPADVEVLAGFTGMNDDDLKSFISERGLAMDLGDIKFCREYFTSEHREPTITEIKMIDTYWSDHCRHTTFGTEIDSVHFEDEILQGAYDRYLSVRKELGRTKPVCMMDIATLAAKYLKQKGILDKLDESEEINACTVKMKVDVDGKDEEWLLLFKNETHNHPTEIEPFGGAATCIGGAIRDPLSGRAYVYGAMRVTGAADPLCPASETIKGKLPQRKIVRSAAAGYSSYGNQIGLATGLVDEIYHPGYAAKRMEIGAVIAAAPAGNVRREAPVPGDVVILLGGSTGRDGIGGATGASKAHNIHSVESCGAEVQKGNAPEERKLQRLFRNGEATRLIKRCNDFGAGGVSVAIGELADGLDINLDMVPKKYEGLDGTELAISESQERMAVVVAKEDAKAFLELAEKENLQAVIVAGVKAEPRMTIKWRGKTIVDVSREFLNSNGAPKHIDITLEASDRNAAADHLSISGDGFREKLQSLAGNLNICSKQGLSERFDSTIGTGTILMPFGGERQLTPIQAMVHKIPLEKGETKTCSLMSYGYNPYLTEKSPYHGAYLAVVESVCKLIATGTDYQDIYLTFQEYFKKPGTDGRRWGQPLSALLGAFSAQLDLGIGAIGGKDSMSGTFESLDVPPTLVSFAVSTDSVDNIISPEFKKAGNKVIMLSPKYGTNGLPEPESMLATLKAVSEVKGYSCYTPGMGGIVEAVMKMAFGNDLGFKYSKDIEISRLFGYSYGSFIIEVSKDYNINDILNKYSKTLFNELGEVTDDQIISYRDEKINLDELYEIYSGKLEPVYPTQVPIKESITKDYSEVKTSKAVNTNIKIARPRVLIPVFPGTNCEYDSARAMRDAGAEPEIFVINNLSANGIAESIEAFAKKLANSQIVFLPGGFSGGDEPDGSGKFITAFFRNPKIKEGVTELLEQRDGLMCGICNGFQALIKLGLVPYGKIMDTDVNCPTLTFNTIGRHQSRIIRTKVMNNSSPWLAETNVGDIYSMPISHGEGRFMAPSSELSRLFTAGQVATCYVDSEGTISSDIRYNPNGSLCAIEGITSPDGRVFGKMGHSERKGYGLYKNVPGSYDNHMFTSAVHYFK